MPKRSLRFSAKIFFWSSLLNLWVRTLTIRFRRAPPGYKRAPPPQARIVPRKKANVGIKTFVFVFTPEFDGKVYLRPQTFFLPLPSHATLAPSPDQVAL